MMFGSQIEIPRGWRLEETGEGRGIARYSAPEGNVDLAFYELLPGVLLTNIDLSCSVLPAFNPRGSQIATINWCTSGRCEVDFGERGSFVVAQDMFCISSSLARSFSYPTDSYRGFEVFVDFDCIDHTTWTLLGSFGLVEDTLRRALLPRELGINLKPEGELATAVQDLLAELELADPRDPWLLLRLCQLLVALVGSDLSFANTPAAYLQRGQRDMAQVVYQHIIDRPSPVVGLAGLAGRFGVSEASLRSYFSRVYGETPAAFARRHVLRRAARLLTEGDLSVAEVSQACGYANPSKFSAAFRRVYGANPLEYRRRSRLSEPEPAEETKGYR